MGFKGHPTPAKSEMRLFTSVLFCLLLNQGLLSHCVIAADRPNILWLTSEDNGPQLGCYGDDYADTPNLDDLATESLRYKMCWSNAPVCAPARTCLISGMYATSIGGQHMRSGVAIPDDMTLYPKLFRDAGYYCTNHTKTDYNLIDADAQWHDKSKRAHWRNRSDPAQPFFAVYNSTISHESKIRIRPHTPVHDPALAPVPSYHPDRAEVRRDWAQYYDKMTEMDTELGRVLEQLREDNLQDDTIIFYYGDHGSGMPRSKRWPFNSGLQVPLILHIPEKFAHLRPADYSDGGVTDRLASFVDMAPTALSLCGIEPPAFMQGIPLAGQFAGKPVEYLFGFRDRMDERIDMARTCTDGRYVYMMHFYPDRPYLKYVEYMFETPTTRIWKEMFDAGQLNEIQAKPWKSKPTEELFDLQNDPDEVVDIASQPQHAQRLSAMRSATVNWMKQTLDTGVYPEHDIHALSSDGSPRQYTLANARRTQMLVDTAVECMSPKTDLARLQTMLGDEDPIVQFWAARGLVNREHRSRSIDESLEQLMLKGPISASIAAAEALIGASDENLRQSATARLIELADPTKTSQFAALAALNILDTKVSLSEEQRTFIKRLPRSADPAPERAERYVGQIMDHLISQ